VLSHVERYLIYKVQSYFFCIGQRGGRWEHDLWIFFLELDVKATIFEKPCFKQTQLPVIWLNQGNLRFDFKTEVLSTGNKMGIIRIT